MMGAKITITPDMVPKVIKERNDATRVAMQLGAYMAATRTQSLLKRRSRKLANDRGVFANAWTVMPNSVAMLRKPQPQLRELCRVENRTPYAGVIELGARPHGVSYEGRLAIEGWVERNLTRATWSVAGRSGGRVATTYTRKQKAEIIHRATQAIIWKLKRHGQRPKYVAHGALGWAHKFLHLEIARQIRRVAAAPGKAA